MTLEHLKELYKNNIDVKIYAVKQPEIKNEKAVYLNERTAVYKINSIKKTEIVLHQVTKNKNFPKFINLNNKLPMVNDIPIIKDKKVQYNLSLFTNKNDAKINKYETIYDLALNVKTIYQQTSNDEEKEKCKIIFEQLKETEFENKLNELRGF